MNVHDSKELKFSVADHLSRIYPADNHAELARELIEMMNLNQQDSTLLPISDKWSERDAWIISYGDSIVDKQNHASGEKPLQTLKKFMNTRLDDVVNGVHILPFFPYSSDDGFAVIDYSQVNESLGDWGDVEAIAEDYTVMADLVINHCSVRSRWFENFKQRKDPGKDYFFEASPDDDLSSVVRPRTSPLLKEVQSLDGLRYVWCTFGHDQVDLDFSNPQVLKEMVLIIRRYLEQGVRVFRLDAVAFLWKKVGTNSIHLPETHEVIRLLRKLIEAHTADAIIITETNVPNHENLSYFGNSNEAHAIYNFSLPPLLLHALITGNCEHLKAWQMSMPPALRGTFYFNFIASHDGVGLRPVKGLLSQSDIDILVNSMQRFGARISWRAAEGGLNEPYEINVALYDALQGTQSGPDKWQLQRFMCAHAIMFALEGIPGIYIHSLLGTNNDYDKVELTRHNRSINRHQWDQAELDSQLDDQKSHHHQVFSQMKKLLSIRKKQAAFHPNAVQFTLHLGSQVFAFWRQSPNRDQSIFCFHNVSDQTVSIPLTSVNLIGLDDWTDLITGKQYENITDEMLLAPYQYVWLTNKSD